MHSSGECFRACSIVIATGARSRRLAVSDLRRYEGRGVWYWASPIEAKLCVNQDVIVVGGGNSAAQAAVFLSTTSAKVRMMVRGGGLAETISQYLIDRIAAAPNMILHTRTELVALSGASEHGLKRVRSREHGRGVDEEAGIRNVFCFIGADPAKTWLSDCGVDLDAAGFVVTGAEPDRIPLRTSVPGIIRGRGRPIRVGRARR